METSLEHPLKHELKFVTFELLSNNPAGMEINLVQPLKQSLKSVACVLYLNNSAGIEVNWEQDLKHKVKFSASILGKGLSTDVSRSSPVMFLLNVNCGICLLEMFAWLEMMVTVYLPLPV